MPGQRHEDQIAKTFSAPRELLERARQEAKVRGWSESGFYRYCLAKACGSSEDEAKKLAEHRAVTLSRERVTDAPSYMLNEKPNSKPESTEGRAAKSAVDKGRSESPKRGH